MACQCSVADPDDICPDPAKYPLLLNSVQATGITNKKFLHKNDL
jgi:hypothetical protein